MAVSNYVFPIVMKSIDSSTFSGAYQAVNTGLDDSCFMVKYINNSTVDITISWDGINDHDFAPAHSAFVADFQTNHQPTNEVALARKGQIIYVKGSAGTGKFYLAAYTQPQTNPRGL